MQFMNKLDLILMISSDFTIEEKKHLWKTIHGFL